MHADVCAPDPRACADRDRRKVGLSPLPAFVPPPEPVPEERKKEILSDPRVVATAARVRSFSLFARAGTQGYNLQDFMPTELFFLGIVPLTIPV